MGGKKRKIAMEFVENSQARAVLCAKRRKGLYSKASELCLLSGAQVAIITTPVSSNSNVSFFSFGHSSADSVVSAFLANQRPRDDDSIGRALGFWWEDQKLAQSENSNELSDAIGSIARMLQNLKGLQERKAVENHEGLKKEEELALHGTNQELDQNQTLNLLQLTCASACIDQDDTPAKLEEPVKISQAENQNVAVSDKDSNDINSLILKLDECDEEFDLDTIFDLVMNSESTPTNSNVSTNQNPSSSSEDGAASVFQGECNRNFCDSDGDNNILAISDNNNNALHGDLNGWNKELDLDDITSFEANAGSLMDDVSVMKSNQNLLLDAEAVEDEAAVMHRALDHKDNFNFSEYCNELTSIAAI
ncbi:unnamed protein product [Microthlaspi erraticum]|uniref:MADS-box domain-containing protein n=1 Tax=Microthlaspi erraticum TaxID=1685480 RepID=A0A6D2ITS8_9BRAS|nr:unnamed protein product [Microthlaspi erraticum]